MAFETGMPSAAKMLSAFSYIFSLALTLIDISAIAGLSVSEGCSGSQPYPGTHDTFWYFNRRFTWLASFFVMD
jgi:hypothetical protein